MVHAPGGPGDRRAVSFVFVTVLIDAMGIGIIIPVMPDLIRELGGPVARQRRGSWAAT